MKDISVVISAPSGAGKSTIIDKLLAKDLRLEFSVSSTTRKKRDSEVDGQDYNFITEDVFKEMIGNNEFLEWAVVHKNYYGTPKKEVDRIRSLGKIPIFDVDIQGTKQLKQNLDKAFFIFIVPPSFTVLEQRLINRKTDPAEQVRIRLNNAWQELNEYALYDYLVVNDDLDEAVDNIQSIINAEQCRRERLTDFIEKILEEKNDHPP